jgi:hypothetical protein
MEKVDYWTEKQKENLKFFDDQLENFLVDPLLKRKYIIIHNQKIAGFFDTFDAALTKAVQTLPEREFVIQQIIGKNDIINFLFPACTAAEAA